MISSGVHSCIYFMPVSLFHYIGYLLILLPRPLSRVIVVGVFLFLVYTFSFALVVSTLEALIGLRHLSLVPLTILMIWVVMWCFVSSNANTRMYLSLHKDFYPRVSLYVRRSQEHLQTGGDAYRPQTGVLETAIHLRLHPLRATTIRA